MNIKVLIADDDKGMRLVLKKVVERVEGFSLAGEAADGKTAIDIYEALNPGLVFLDIEMPKINGVECAKRIADSNPKTVIIFATAHEGFMQEAFEVYAFDYLLKPFKVERVVHTLERVRERLSASTYSPLQEIVRLEKGLAKLVINGRDGIFFLDMEDILLVQRENHNTVIHTSKNRYTTSDSLSELEAKLDGSLFYRSHKSYIINLSAVYKIEPFGRWTYVVKLRNTEKDALVTHDRMDELQKAFNKNR